MRKSLNDNPVVAVIVVGVLGLGVALLLLSGLGSSSSSSSTSATTTTSSVPAAPGAATTTPTTPAAAPAGSVTPSVPSAAAAPSVAATPVGAFVAGPGLPAPVVSAYARGEVVALLIVKRNGIDDHAVRTGFAHLRGMAGVASFETLAKDVARYARITEGVDLDRVPALVVMRPRSVTHGGTPRATVTYGFNGPEQIVQAVRDSLYHGPENLPYHPR